MDTQEPDPEPRRTPGLDPGGLVPPGETPPGEGSTGAETGPRDDLSKGWAKGPAIIIGIVVILCAAFFMGYAVLYAL